MPIVDQYILNIKFCVILGFVFSCWDMAYRDSQMEEESVPGDDLLDLIADFKTDIQIKVSDD